ncbi:helix-turn-helix domain-containing protein [Streptomyces mirabilis]|uniref:helix-turn-helix domain-containing protein n=1 Tax=Streptomyces mirabilis TaxID=68239 RepID=UPI0036AACDA4
MAALFTVGRRGAPSLAGTAAFHQASRRVVQGGPSSSPAAAKRSSPLSGVHGRHRPVSAPGPQRPRRGRRERHRQGHRRRRTPRRRTGPIHHEEPPHPSGHHARRHPRVAPAQPRRRPQHLQARRPCRCLPRILTRLWRQETGVSPYQWLLTARINRARELLETTDLQVEQIAIRCGLGSGANMRARFRDALGITPTAYRRTFHHQAA